VIPSVTPLTLSLTLLTVWLNHAVTPDSRCSHGCSQPPLGPPLGRPRMRRATLDQVVKVRVLTPQPPKSPLPRLVFRVAGLSRTTPPKPPEEEVLRWRPEEPPPLTYWGDLL
jgi:hypothetical protein